MNGTYHRTVPDPGALPESDQQVRWLDDREVEAWRAVRELGQPLWGALGRELQRDSGLSIADYEVLVVLSAARNGMLPYRDLARTTEWEKSRLSHHVTRMEQRGLVSRQECPDDARAAHIALTVAGRQAIERAAPGHVAEVRRLLMDDLTPDQLDTLAVVGRQLRARLTAAGDGADAAEPGDAGCRPDC
jgi:DNA-binding MarR family transcriptional regulator